MVGTTALEQAPFRPSGPTEVGSISASAEPLPASGFSALQPTRFKTKRTAGTTLPDSGTSRAVMGSAKNRLPLTKGGHCYTWVATLRPDFNSPKSLHPRTMKIYHNKPELSSQHFFETPLRQLFDFGPGLGGNSIRRFFALFDHLVIDNLGGVPNHF